MHPNSLKAYRERVEPELTPREAEVLKALKEMGKGNCNDVAAHMTRTLGRTVFPNHISGRFRPLEEKGRIKGTTMDGKTVWTPTEPIEIARNPVQTALFTGFQYER